MHEILEKIRKIGIVPVVALDDAKDALPLAEALQQGGLPCAEITFRTQAAEEAIRLISRECPEMLVGAGTVLTTEQADRAAAAGAEFLVSPGFNPRVVKHCVEKGILITPGCSTPSDIEQALENGLDVVKFFPAEPSGGLKMIQALAAPYGQVRFMPTGGIHPENAQEYLRCSRVLACGGSWMVKSELIKTGAFDKIRQLSQEAAQIVKECRG
ncbi:MAG: bifunctional 4-hydroxy-2-oxoglutarate aldolase/2-dehydro-3-deoxy-phosphogluconate aldolase [Lachnospiraceae bacterium]|nr:bifunctional 4-hydroxy-2-oxoglutarate aldolase/2-dehydro-3-deoxy-phosphogluconate aldolase [Lachnospiraceae bacterium]